MSIFSRPPYLSRRNLPQPQFERIEKKVGAFHIPVKADKFYDYILSGILEWRELKV
jgi:hypothetical protein